MKWPGNIMPRSIHKSGAHLMTLLLFFMIVPQCHCGLSSCATKKVLQQYDTVHTARLSSLQEFQDIWARLADTTITLVITPTGDTTTTITTRHATQNTAAKAATIAADTTNSTVQSATKQASEKHAVRHNPEISILAIIYSIIVVSVFLVLLVYLLVRKRAIQSSR